MPQYDGIAVRQTGNSSFYLDTGSSEAGLFTRGLDTTVFGYVDFVKGAGAYYLGGTGHNFRVGPYGSQMGPLNLHEHIDSWVTPDPVGPAALLLARFRLPYSHFACWELGYNEPNCLVSLESACS